MRAAGQVLRGGGVVSGVVDDGLAWICDSGREGRQGSIDDGLASVEDPVYVEMRYCPLSFCAVTEPAYTSESRR